MARVLILLCAVALLAVVPSSPEDLEFSSTTIDLGMVVKDVDASVAFYTEVLGFTEGPGFTGSRELCVAAGLTADQGLVVRVLTLGEGDKVTKLKMMQCDDAKPAPGDTTYIPSQLGFRYLTVYVADLGAHLERLAAHGVSPLAQGPVALSPDGAKGANLAAVRDPDGNLIELIGPLETE